MSLGLSVMHQSAGATGPPQHSDCAVLIPCHCHPPGRWSPGGRSRPGRRPLGLGSLLRIRLRCLPPMFVPGPTPKGQTAQGTFAYADGAMPEGEATRASELQVSVGVTSESTLRSA